MFCQGNACDNNSDTWTWNWRQKNAVISPIRQGCTFVWCQQDAMIRGLDDRWQQTGVRSRSRRLMHHTWQSVNVLSANKLVAATLDNFSNKHSPSCCRYRLQRVSVRLYGYENLIKGTFAPKNKQHKAFPFTSTGQLYQHTSFNPWIKPALFNSLSIPFMGSLWHHWYDNES